jgi:hypothetical protein
MTECLSDKMVSILCRYFSQYGTQLAKQLAFELTLC